MKMKHHVFNHQLSLLGVAQLFSAIKFAEKCWFPERLVTWGEVLVPVSAAVVCIFAVALIRGMLNRE